MDVTAALPSEAREIAECVYQIDPDVWPEMKVPVRIVADPVLMAEVMRGRAIQQLAELATLPGAWDCVVGFPNLSESWGFPTGAVLATEYPDGALVPSGVGPDVNCGLRLLTTPLSEPEVAPRLIRLLDELERELPIGTERGSPHPLTERELQQLLKEGCRFLVRERGIGLDDDLGVMDSGGHFHDADGAVLSGPAKSAALGQLGTLGRGGSHFVELGVVDELYEPSIARRLGLSDRQVVVLIHAGARGLGERIYEEARQRALNAMALHRIPSRRAGLEFAPLSTAQGLWCYHALRAAANYGWANRHALSHAVRSAFEQVFGRPGSEVVQVAYDASTNTVDVERVESRIVCVHRRAAAPAFGPMGRAPVPPVYRDLGQPVLLPGSMGSSSYVMVATEAAEPLARASVCHGAGRTLSRQEARKRVSIHALEDTLRGQGVVFRTPSQPEVREEAPEAYRDVDRVAQVLERAGLARKVARLRPRAVLKG